MPQLTRPINSLYKLSSFRIRKYGVREKISVKIKKKQKKINRKTEKLKFQIKNDV